MSYFDLNRGALRPPISDSRKLMPIPAGIAAGIGSGIDKGVSAIGSIIGGNIAANKDYENKVRLIDKMNEYNTPVNQRARLEAAGFNPYLLSGGINPGNQSEPGDVSAGTNARSNGYLAAANQVGAMAEQIANVRKTNAEASATEINNETRRTENQLRIDTAQAQLDDLTFKIKNMNPESLRKLKNEADEVAQRHKNLILEGDNLRLVAFKLMSEIRGQDLDNAQKEEFLDQYEAYLRLQRSVLQMQISTGYQNANSNSLSARANMLGSSAAMMNAETARKMLPHQTRNLDSLSDSYDLKNSYDRSTYYDRVGQQAWNTKSAKHQAEMDEFDMKSQNSTWWTRFVQGFLPFTPGMYHSMRGR